MGRSTGVDQLEERVVRAAHAALARNHFVSPVDVLVGLGWLPQTRLDEWRQGRVDTLETVMSANLSKVSRSMTVFRRWARQQGLSPSETAYLARTRDRRPLRFSKSGNPEIERAYRTHWVSPELSESNQERLRERLSRPPDLVVIDPEAITLAVRASVRHEDTRYDKYLMSGTDRSEARARVCDEVEGTLDRWRTPAP